MDRSIKIKTITQPPKGRTIAISDIHANLDGYQALLEKVRYQKGIDRLMIVGDFIEKGTKNLDTLHYLMKQSEQEDVHCIMGNCDFICKNVLYSYRLDFLHNILLMRKESLIHEMADTLGLVLDKDTDMEQYCQTIRKHYLKELSFCNDCPHIIETEDTIYVHAALQSPDHYGDDFKEVINEPFFLKQDKHYEKRVVVGHMPVTEYCHQIATFDPIYNSKMNVYSIDGGNVVKKRSGQLNALIFEGKKVSVDHVDNLPEIKVANSVEPNNPLPLFVTWNERKTEILRRDHEYSLVYSKALKRKFYVENEFFENHSVSEYTNYQMPLTKGETVKLVYEYGNKVQIKKNGVLGWAYRSDLEY